MEFYAQADFDQNKADKRREMLTTFAAALPFVAAAIVFFFLRAETACIVSCFLAGAVLILLFDLKIMPAVRYGRFLSEANSGLSRKTAGTLVRISEDLAYVDGVNFREVIINIYEDMSEEGERRFLCDEAREIPQAFIGRDIALKSHGNYVLGVELLGQGISE